MRGLTVRQKKNLLTLDVGAATLEDKEDIYQHRPTFSFQTVVVDDKTNSYVIDASDMSLGLTPNFTHSYDATLLFKIIEIYLRKINNKNNKESIIPLYVVHDCVYFAGDHYSFMLESIREAIVEVFFTTDILTGLFTK